MPRVLRKSFYQTATLGKKSSTSMVLRARQGGASLCAPCVFLGDNGEWAKGKIGVCMILYFSAEGNSRYVAERIAEHLGDVAVSIEAFKGETNPHIAVEEGGCLGFIAPTYCWGLPTPAVDFLKRATFEVPANAYVFTATTFGTTAGQTTRFAVNLLHERGVETTAQYGVQMPDTWTLMFDLSDTEKVAAINARADEQIDECAQMIANRAMGNHVRRAVPMFAAKLYYRFGLPACQDTSKFSVDANACVGCGLCAKRCPADAIKMHDGVPTWNKPECAACLRCLHSCPKGAIQRGPKTRAHGQYLHP